MPRIIIGIDPGSRITGYGVIRQHKYNLEYLTCGVIKVFTKASFADRLEEIHRGITEVINKYQPQEMAIEDIFVAINPRSALKLGHARGVLLLAGKLAGLAIHEYTPRTVKQTVTGYGHAEKTQMQQAVRVLLKLSAVPGQDAADALGIAICHAHHSPELGAARK